MGWRTAAIDFEQIAKEITTMFTSWEDFIKECLHVYIKSWTDPAKAQDLMQKAWIPHFKPKQLEYMKEMMPPEEYQKFTERPISIQNIRKYRMF